jgi:hypothetical protein
MTSRFWHVNTTMWHSVDLLWADESHALTMSRVSTSNDRAVAVKLLRPGNVVRALLPPLDMRTLHGAAPYSLRQSSLAA